MAIIERIDCEAINAAAIHYYDNIGADLTVDANRVEIKFICIKGFEMPESCRSADGKNCQMIVNDVCVANTKVFGEKLLYDKRSPSCPLYGFVISGVRVDENKE